MIEIISEWGIKEVVWLAAIFVTVMFFIIGCSMKDKVDFDDEKIQLIKKQAEENGKKAG